MKAYRIIVSFFISLICLVSFTMDLPNHYYKSPSVINNKHTAILHDLNNIINAKYPPSAHRFTSGKDMMPCIIDILVMYKNPLPLQIFDSLFTKNNIFERVVHYLIKIADKNLENITPQTLTIVQNHRQKQPEELLNTLPLSLKLYVMSKAFNKIEYRYEIELSHKTTVLSADICPATDQAVTSTADNMLNFWDLKTGVRTYTIEESDTINEVCFNQNGTQLATAIRFPQSTTIKIWNPQSKKLLHCIKDAPFLVTNLEYTTSIDNPTLCSYYFSTESNLSAALWAIKQKEIQGLGSLSIYPSPLKPNIIKENYTVRKPAYTTSNKTSLFIIKKCPLLKLCGQTIKKIKTIESLQAFQKEETYSGLSSLEQTLLIKPIKKKELILKKIVSK